MIRLTLEDGRSIVLTNSQLEQRPIEYMEFLEHSISITDTDEEA